MTEVEYLNKVEQRNKWNVQTNMYNCGGLALNTFSWYLPYDEDEVNEIDDEIGSMVYYDDYSEESAANYLAQMYVSFMLKEFKCLRLLQSPDEVKDGERLIAFRTMVNCVDEDWPPDTDFHYRYYEDGHWWEKCGAKDIKKCDHRMKEHSWVYHFGEYNSRTIYLALKMEF